MENYPLCIFEAGKGLICGHKEVCKGHLRAALREIPGRHPYLRLLKGLFGDTRNILGLSQPWKLLTCQTPHIHGLSSRVGFKVLVDNSARESRWSRQKCSLLGHRSRGSKIQNLVKTDSQHNP